MHVLLSDVFNGYYLVLVKEINRLISKGMSNIYYWEKLTFSKLAGKEHFSKRNFEEMHLLWIGKRYKWRSGKDLFYFSITVFSCFLSTNLCLRFLFIGFSQEVNDFLSQFLREWGWFQGDSECFPKDHY